MIKKEIYEFFKPIILKNKFTFILISLNGFIYGVVGVLTPFLLKIETDQLVNQKSYNIFGKDIGAFGIFGIILACILFVNILDNLIKAIVKIHVSAKRKYLENTVEYHFYKRYETMEIGKLMNSRYLVIKDLIEQEIQSFTNRLIEGPSHIINFFVSIIGITAIYYILDFKLLFVVIISSFIGYLLSLGSRKLGKKYEVSWVMSNQKTLYKYNSLISRETKNVAIAGGLGDLLNRYSNLLESEIKNNKEKEYGNLAYSIGNLLNENLFSIILKLIVGYGVFKGTQSISMVTFVVASMGKIQSITTTIFNFKKDYNDFNFSQECILLYFKLTNEIGEKNFNEKLNSFELKNIEFSYPKSSSYEYEYIEKLKKYVIGKDLGDNYIDRQIKKLLEELHTQTEEQNERILNNLNIKFETGKIYGLVGKNGAGKSTLMYLLSGFFREYSGEILFNNTQTKNIFTKDLLNKVSFLTQTPFSMGWGTSIYANLTLGVENIDENKIWHYLNIFGLEKKIKKLKDGLNTELGRDIDFSGGEIQILAFIRLLLQDKEIIIMDEGTNQLDAENEVLVMNELLKQKDKKIIIFITHRMSTISKADIIYCLENGEIKHFGTHKELLGKNDNIYATFYKTQILHDNV